MHSKVKMRRVPYRKIFIPQILLLAYGNKTSIFTSTVSMMKRPSGRGGELMACNVDVDANAACTHTSHSRFSYVDRSRR